MASYLRRIRRARQRGRQHTNDAPHTVVRIMLAMVLATVLTVALGVGSAAAAAYGVYSYYAQGLPSPEAVETRQTLNSSLIYDRKGRLLYEVFDPRFGRRQSVTLGSISPYLIQATIATEDHDFYLNSGINTRGVVRAGVNMLSNLLGDGEGSNLQGGSSITQQLVKNVLIPEEERAQRLVSRKIKEAILAYALTEHYSKDQILEWYLNENNYGNLSYGVESAAQSYFGKPARDLTLPESAMLAGLPQAPANYSPLLDPAAATQRQRDVLGLMVRQGYITQEEADAAAAVELGYKTARYTIEAPHFVMYVRDLLEQKYGRQGLYRRGLKVTTSLDLDLQNFAQERVRRHVEENGARFSANNAALVAIDPKTGEILTMVGSIDYFNAEIQGQVNMITSERQPGSSFKPITYLAAFMKGWSPATVVLDTALTMIDDLGLPWSPVNNDDVFRGPVSVRTALSNSMNVPAVRAILHAGVQPVIDMAHRLGITGLNREHWYGPALTLGGGEVKPLDHAFVYSVFANNGKMRGQAVAPDARRPGYRNLEPVAILKVEERDGTVIEEFLGPEEQEVVPAPYAYLITHILSDNPARSLIFGPNNLLHLRDRPAAAKTGTTEDNKDNWIAGYTPDLVTVVWVGNTDNAPMVKNAFGSSNAGPIWYDFMVHFHEGKPPSPFVRPTGVVDQQICLRSGLLPGDVCPDRRSEIFVLGNVPKTMDTDAVVQIIRVDRTTGQTATPETPPQNIEDRVIMPVSPELRDRFAGQNIPAQSERSASLMERVTVSVPGSGSRLAGVVTVTGSASSEAFMGYVLEYGAGVNPSNWATIFSATAPVDNGPLGTLDARTLNGDYTLRLTVLDRERGPQSYRVIFTAAGS